MDLKFDPDASFPTSETLIGAVKKGNADAWKQLFDLYAPVILFWCRTRFKPPPPQELQADIMQDVWIRLLSNIGSFQHESFRGYLWKTTFFVAQDRFALLKKQRALSTGGSEAHILLATIEDKAEFHDDEHTADERYLLAHRIVATVEAEAEPSTMRLFRLYFIEGRSPQEIAEELNEPVGPLYNRINRLKNKIRKRFGMEL